MGILQAVMGVASKVKGSTNTLGSGLALVIAAGLYFGQTKGLTLTDAQIVSISWGADCLLTHVFEKLFPKAKDFDDAVMKTAKEILAQMPQTYAEFPPSKGLGK